MNMMNQGTIGAGETLQYHEVLCSSINAINQFQLYQPYCQDPELKNILQNQLNFMVSEYNAMVQALNSKGNSTSLPPANLNKAFTPSYGMTPSSPEQPNNSMNQMNDRDVASGMRDCSKASAIMRTYAALECSDPQLRNMMAQGARNCIDQAYETWTYMNKNGYYRVPVFDQATMNTLLSTYQSTNSTFGMPKQNQQLM
ncbi:spore coat protein [Neobacillus sp. D3-1R]|uniref:spore coat protein n=1 Tax=Neobacillus sp. D3-1R TaxID=3445778 RepID=UPI003FA0E03B